MDSYTGKRVSGRLGFSRGGSTLSFRDPNQEDRSTQYCSRLGCSSRLNSMKGNQGSNQEKMNYSKTPFRSTSGKAAAGSSSRSSSSCSSDFRKTYQGGPNRKFLRETVIAESSSRQGELEEESDSSSRLGETDDSEFGSVASSNQAVLPDQEELESPILQGISSNSCTATPSSRPHKQLNRLLGSSKQDTSGSSLRRSSVSRNTSGAKKPISQGMSSGAPRYGLKNLGCTSISDVFPSGCSSSDVSNSRKAGLIRKRGYDGGSSSTGLVKTSGYSAGGNSGSLGRGLSGLLSERSSPQQASRRARNQPANRDGAVSVRTRRAPGGETRVRSPKQEVDNIVAPSETVAIIQLPPNQDSIMDSVPESSSSYFTEDPPPVARNNTFGRLGTSGRSARTRSSARVDDSSAQIFRGPPGDRETYRRFNMEGIAEVLLALERIEQDEELTYEQLLVLETNLFLGGLSFHDQHRDMRMDIDNMSYEELLALEEKMGTVSTALSEESLAKCLRKSIYGPVSLLPGITCRGDDDIKCSICQEEYVAGDELGRLACEHRYHVACIHAWLRQKNCCPICKVSISPS